MIDLAKKYLGIENGYHDAYPRPAKEFFRELYSIIDDRLSKLVEDGFICRAERGVFVPIIQHPASRVISKTILPDGTTVIDVGDEVLTLTPREAMSLGKLLMGDAMALAGVEMGHQFTQLNGILSRQILQMQRQVSDLQQENLSGVAKDDTV